MIRIAPLTVLLAALVLVDTASAQKTTLTLTVQIDKIEEAKGEVTKLYITSKAAGIKNSPHNLSKKIKIFFDDEKESRELTPKTLLTDEAAKEYFQTGKTIRELCREEGVLPDATLNDALDPWRMTEPRE